MTEDESWDVEPWGGSWFEFPERDWYAGGGGSWFEFPERDWYAGASVSLGVRSSPAFHLGSLAELEALDESYPLPDVDVSRLKRDTGQAYRLVVASAGLAVVAPGSSATDAGAVADRLAERLRDFLKRKGLLERHDVEATRGFNSTTLTSPVVGRRVEWRWRLGRRVEWRLPSEAFIVKRDGEWTEVMRGELTEADALLADFLEELEDLDSAKRIRDGGSQEPLWRRWVGAEGGLPPALMALVCAAWLSVEAERAAPVAAPRVRRHKGALYAQVPKVLGAIQWALGAEGQRLDADGKPLPRVSKDTPGEVVGGDEHRTAPMVARYVSRSLGLVPAGRFRQGLLPVETAVEPLAVRVLTDSQAVVSGVGGKVALLLAVAAPESGGLCRMTVDELCRWLWPDAKRGPQLRDRQTAVEAVRALRSLSVVLPNTVDFPLWQIAAPDATAPAGDMEVTFGWSGLATAEELGGKVPMLNGRFLLNLSGAMRLSASHALELRTYVYTAAGWNEARRGGKRSSFDADFTPRGTAEELAARVNALSPPALQYLSEQGKGRKSEQGKGRKQDATDDKRRMVQALERLAEGEGLIRLEKTPGARGVYTLSPPEAFLEAYERVRQLGMRPLKPAK